MTNKYSNKKVVLDGITFDSKAEAKYYLHLKEQQEKEAILFF